MDVIQVEQVEEMNGLTHHGMVAHHVVSPAHVPVPLGEAPEEAAEADGHGLLEVARVLRRVRRRSLLPLLRLVRVVDDGVAVWKGDGK